MRADAATANNNDECFTELLQAIIGKEDSVAGQLLYYEVFVVVT